MPNNTRKFLPSFSDLVDVLTIDQIKEVLKENSRTEVRKQIRNIESDLNQLISDNKVTLDAKLIRMIVIMAQANLHIWHCKDLMSSNPEKYDYYLGMAHKINGIRNQMKNKLLDHIGNKDISAKKTNDSTDDLNWEIDLG